MYGLKEAGIPAFTQLVKKLAPYGYSPVTNTPRLWHHISRPTTFTLCVDDFGVKYLNLADANHLINTVQTSYATTVNWNGSIYCGLTINWNYSNESVNISMRGYVHRALKKFDHIPPQKPQHAPHKWVEPSYGQRTPQAPTPTSIAPRLDKKGTQRIQAIAGTFLYYTRGVDPTILPALNELASEQAAPTTDTETKPKMLMDYLHTHPAVTIQYHASVMVLHVESDADCLVLPKAQSRAAGHYFFSNWPRPAPHKHNPAPNGPIHTLCKTIKNVMSSAAESETGGVYMNGKESIPIRTTASERGHPQPPTPIKTDNTTVHGILAKSLRPKISKAFDMRFHWMKDRIQQKQFHLYWEKGALNMADYFSKQM
jgi:hypothetical protein